MRHEANKFSSISSTTTNALLATFEKKGVTFTEEQKKAMWEEMINGEGQALEELSTISDNYTKTIELNKKMIDALKTC